MVCLTKIILYVVILSRDAKFYKLILERPALLKESMYLTCYFHILPLNTDACVTSVR